MATQPPQSTVEKVRYRVADLSDSNPLASDFEIVHEAIGSALSRYSQDRPREIVADVTGNGTEFYALTGGSPVLASWSDEFSRVVSIDYPASAVAVGYTPTWLDPDLDWTLYETPTIRYLRFKTHQPQATETARITYTGLHVHSTTSDTVPPADLDALCDLAAHYVCLALATKMAASQDSLIASDSQNYRDGQLRFKQQAEAWEQSYFKRMDIDPKGGAAGASATADWTRTGTTGWPMLTHSRRWGR